MVFKTGIFHNAFCATGILSQTDPTDGYILQLHDNTVVIRFIGLYMCYNTSLYAIYDYRHKHMAMFSVYHELLAGWGQIRSFEVKAG